MLNAIYEGDFLGFSFGFRPGRGPHDALDALVVAISTRRVNYILDADVRSFFDSVSQDWLVRFVEHRVGDKRIVRLIRRWRKAGILEDGTVTVSERGTGQGSVISPLLANVYLHYVLDRWTDRWRRREATGDMVIVRYADDVVVGFEHEDDADRFLDAMRARLETFALSLHPDKTRLLEFGCHAAIRRKQRGLGKPETFTFLGFTFICGKPGAANPCSRGKAVPTACGRSLRRTKRSYDIADTSRSPSRGNGWHTSSAASSITLQCQRTPRHCMPSAAMSGTFGGARSNDAVNATKRHTHG